MNRNVLRQWALLRLLPRFPRKISISELAQHLDRLGFETTVRTLQRDLNNLVLSFPVIADDAKPQGWSWSRDAPQLNFPEHDQQTAINFLLARMHLDRILPKASLNYLKPWFNAADDALNLYGPTAAKLNQKIRIDSRSYKLQPPVIDAGLLEIVYEALLKERCLKVKYRSRSRSTEATDVHLVHPMAIVIVDAVSYLIVIYDGHSDIRHLAMHRLIEASSSDVQAKYPKEFDLDDYIANGHFGFIRDSKPLLLRFRIKTAWAKHLYETPLTDDQQINDLQDGWTSVSATVLNNSQIRWWLRGFGPDLIVDGPSSLAMEFKKEAIESLKNYENQ